MPEIFIPQQTLSVSRGITKFRPQCNHGKNGFANKKKKGEKHMYNSKEQQHPPRSCSILRSLFSLDSFWHNLTTTGIINIPLATRAAHQHKNCCVYNHRKMSPRVFKNSLPQKKKNRERKRLFKSTYKYKLRRSN